MNPPTPCPFPLERVRQTVMRHEGVRLKAYTCPAGKLTIGFGRNLEARGISLFEAQSLLENDLAQSVGELERFLPWWRGLPRLVGEVLVDLAFNLGIHGLLTFRKALSALKAQQWEEAAKELLDSKWARQVGPRAQEAADKVRLLAQVEAKLLWGKELPAFAKGVLAEILGQTGWTGLKGLEEFLAALQWQDFFAAAKELLDTPWARQNPKLAQELALRLSSKVNPCLEFN